MKKYKVNGEPIEVHEDDVNSFLKETKQKDMKVEDDNEESSDQDDSTEEDATVDENNQSSSDEVDLPKNNQEKNIYEGVTSGKCCGGLRAGRDFCPSGNFGGSLKSTNVPRVCRGKCTSGTIEPNTPNGL